MKNHPRIVATGLVALWLTLSAQAGSAVAGADPAAAPVRDLEENSGVCVALNTQTKDCPRDKVSLRTDSGYAADAPDTVAFKPAVIAGEQVLLMLPPAAWSGLLAQRIPADYGIPAEWAVQVRDDVINSGLTPKPLTYQATIDDARAAIRQAMVDTKTPSISVALSDGKRIVWSETFGTIDQARQTAPSATTMYGIGSVSKVIAAIAAMKLVDQGLVDLDAPLVRYVTDFRMASSDAAQITIRMLLSHASGLPGTEKRNIFTFAPVSGYAARVLQTLSTQRLKHRPGELADYCNDGFTLIEPLVAAVTGRPYTRFVEDEILKPLGMAHSRFALAPFPAGSYAPAFREDGTPWPQEYVNAYAAGGLYSTPDDMTRLAMMFMNGGQYQGTRILSEAALAEMGRDQTKALAFNPLPANHWGLGWDGVAQPGLAALGVTVWYKDGGTPSYGSEFFVAPQERLALMITGTSQAYPSQALAERIMLKALAERGRIAAVPAPLPEVAQPQLAPTDADLATMAGDYADSRGLWRVEVQPDRTLKSSRFSAGTWSVEASGLKRRADGTFSSWRSSTRCRATCLPISLVAQTKSSIRSAATRGLGKTTPAQARSRARNCFQKSDGIA